MVLIKENGDYRKQWYGHRQELFSGIPGDFSVRRKLAVAKKTTVGTRFDSMRTPRAEQQPMSHSLRKRNEPERENPGRVFW
ncbi:Integrase [Caenorhabditis elegans]|uniref:Integrase n=1 Tax=Caenorhabditis elegans TaxID=6239 RepID=E3W723_CAEEL|nr:Integrase [Caenorhabditis elegans]CCD67882.1 Integrase [Caenorhabditis elegans]|eukprot:NP_001256061.1 Uncharacterized protein CELE_K09H11.15 [Caenorhabditis elegans]